MALPVGVAGLCALALCTCSIAHALKHQRNDYYGHIVHDAMRGGTEKRSSSLIIKGLASLQKLLTGAKQVATHHSDYRLYSKPGDSATAIKDFYSVKPYNVKEKNGGYYITHKKGRAILGTVGDRRLRLLVDGDYQSKGEPVLEVIDHRAMSGPYVDRIIYKSVDD